jgi:hypothetical protein
MYRVVKPAALWCSVTRFSGLTPLSFEVAMENFPAMFHEPYYRHYTTDDLNLRLTNAGLNRSATRCTL